MASVWQFESTRGSIFQADAQSADPEELQVLDISLEIQLVVGVSGPNIPRHTEGSLQMTSSLCLSHIRYSNIQSHIPMVVSQSRPRRIALV